MKVIPLNLPSKQHVKISILLFFLIAPCISKSQSLTPEKIRKVKSCTLQIITDSTVGTGFFIDSKGTVATCLHVVLNSIIYNKQVRARTNKGDIFELQLSQLTDSGVAHASAYDLIILKPKRPFISPTPFLKLNTTNKLEEGQEVYTCGYPFGDSTQFVSKGIISTKLTRVAFSDISIAGKSVKIAELRNELLLDITSNHGNSGGALLKLNSTINEDVVVGIIDYSLTPFGKILDSLKINIANSSWVI